MRKERDDEAQEAALPALQRSRHGEPADVQYSVPPLQMSQKTIICVCGRYPNIVPIPSGTRIDLTCDRCGHRVQTDSNTVGFFETGLAELVCWECAELSGIIQQ